MFLAHIVIKRLQEILIYSDIKIIAINLKSTTINQKNILMN